MIEFAGRVDGHRCLNVINCSMCIRFYSLFLFITALGKWIDFGVSSISRGKRRELLVSWPVNIGIIGLLGRGPGPAYLGTM